MLLIALTVTLLVTVHCSEPMDWVKGSNDGSETIRVKPPKLSEEESESNFIPDHMKCDGCHAAAFQVYLALLKMELKFMRMKQPVPESELLETFEKTCHPSTFVDYVLIPIDGKNELSGPGIEKNADDTVMMQRKGQWPGRLSAICLEFIDEHEESDIYDAFNANEKDMDAFKEHLCSGKKFCKGAVKTKDEL